MAEVLLAPDALALFFRLNNTKYHCRFFSPFLLFYLF